MSDKIVADIVFCLPGRSFSNHFLLSWSETIFHLNKKGYKYLLSTKYSSNVYYVRSMCLGGNVLAGTTQLPFQGQVDYKYLMWIDSDQVWKPEQIVQLLSRNVDIVGGLYQMEGGGQFTAVEKWDEEYFRQNGSFQFMTPDDIAGQTDLIEVSYNGFGFMLIKKGVFEAIGYPWFRPEYQLIGGLRDFASEDVSFCKIAQEKGFKVHVDPTVIVGHEKVAIY